MKGIRTLISAAAILVAAASPGRAAPPSANFGDTVTTNVKLTADITGAGTGLIVGAHGITIDLNGHTISSTDGTGYGIDNEGGFDGVTIRGGTIEGFKEGIRSVGGDDLVVVAMCVEGVSGGTNEQGAIHVLESTGLEITRSDVSVPTEFDGQLAILLESVEDALVASVCVTGGRIGVAFSSIGADDPPTTGVIRDCVIEDCVTGIGVLNSDDAIVKANTVRNANGGGVLPLSATEGVRIGAVGVANVEVVGNEMHDVGIGIVGVTDGFSLTNLSIKGNRSYDNNRGMIFVAMSDSSIRDNDVSGNVLFGLALNGCDDNTISDNKANGNTLRGIVLVNGSDGNLIRDNEANDNGLQGISLLVGVNVDNEIVDNQALGNGAQDLFHNATSTPNTWKDNDYDTASGDDIP